MNTIYHTIFVGTLTQKAVSLVLRGYNITFDEIVIISVRLQAQLVLGHEFQLRYNWPFVQITWV